MRWGGVERNARDGATLIKYYKQLSYLVLLFKGSVKLGMLHLW